MKGRYYTVLILLLAILATCREPYQPPSSANQVNLLVVDGFMNATDSVAQVSLSRATQLSSSETPPPVTDANVSIEDSQGGVYALSQTDAGVYAQKIIFNPQYTYKLHIATADGKNYSSDFVPLLQAPKVDSVTWEAGNAGVAIQVNAHDSTRSTKYYRWTFQETWEYNSAFSSSVMFVNGTAVARPVDQNVYICWRTVPSTQISVYTTSHLVSDVVSKFQVNFLPQGTQKLGRKYSILVQQQALTEEGYNFWSQLQRTTENLGGLFDPLPSQVVGNVVCETNPSEPVLGFFGGSTVTTKRTFIKFYDLPDYLQIFWKYPNCLLDSIPVASIPTLGGSGVLVSSYGTGPVGYTSSSLGCVDCRVQGGTTIQPSFWK